jgi:hypothetical protein
MPRGNLRARAGNASRCKRRVGYLLALLSAGMLCLVASASAGDAQPRSATASPFLLGIEDNAQMLGNAAGVLPDIETLDPAVFRFTIFWSQVARRRPAIARNSNDRAYDWSHVDGVARQISELDIPLLFTIVSTPRWAGGGSKGVKAPKKMTDLQNFAYAAAQRYSGTHVDADGATLPKVVRWEAWNEPNLQTHLRPQWKAVGRKRQVGRPFCFGKSWVPASPGIYRGILNAIYRGVHAAGRAAGLTEQVAGGATAPYGRGPCAVVPGFAPLAFLRDLVEKRVSLDAWSHHPYRNGRQNAAPYRGDNVDVQGMPRLYAALRKAFHGRKVPVWVTEFGAQTKPPDTRQGVSLSQQSAQLRQAVSLFRRSGRVKMLIWFLVRDEDIAGRSYAAGFQSGLAFFSGKRKPAFAVFRSLARR